MILCYSAAKTLQELKQMPAQKCLKEERKESEMSSKQTNGNVLACVPLLSLLITL
jgi:hypothetical protein